MCARALYRPIFEILTFLHLQVKQNVALALSSIFLASLTSVLGFLPLWLTVCFIQELYFAYSCFGFHYFMLLPFFVFASKKMYYELCQLNSLRRIFVIEMLSFVKAHTLFFCLYINIQVLLHEGGTLLVCLNSIRALHDPTWSWRHNIQTLVEKLKSLLLFKYRGTTQAAPL